MSLDIAVVMDPIESINIKKDTSFAMLLEAQRRGWRLHYATTGDLATQEGVAVARLSPLEVKDDPSGWFRLGNPRWRSFSEMKVALMRRDPPVDAQYLYDTHVLSLAQAQGCLVVNDPQGLRDMNEKLFALHFPQCCPPTRVSRDPGYLRAFVESERDCVLKPLDGMGGRSIFRARAEDQNLKVIIETLTQGGRQLALAQRYLPEIREGDKRILLVDGEPVGAINRVPQKDQVRSNLRVGGTAQPVELTARDREICAAIGPTLKERGLIFVGIDVIGDWMTEINVTSPTGAQQLKRFTGIDATARMWEVIEARRAAG